MAEPWSFVALDVETANSDQGSICQIGIVKFVDGIPTETFATLVNPETWFDSINVSIHGINEHAVIFSPKFPEIIGAINNFIGDQIVVSHSLFDANSLRRAHARYQIKQPERFWLDTTRVIRRTWPAYSYSGYGLSNLCSAFSIPIVHHDAAQDALATGTLLSLAIQASGKPLSEWKTAAFRPLQFNLSSHRIQQSGDPSGPFYGGTVVFTGKMAMLRHEAAQAAAALGLNVDENVTKRTNILVIGEQDADRLRPGMTKSTKHIKAEALVKVGADIKFLYENDFVGLLQIQPAG